MPDPMVPRLLKWCLASLIVIIALLCYALASARSDGSFESDTRATFRLLLDPNATAISDEDRKRVRDLWFPELKEK